MAADWSGSMNVKHTPGPWHLSPPADSVPWLHICCADNKGPWHQSRSDDEKIANSRLIAAATDLLALVIQYRDDLRRPPAPNSVTRRLEAIDAAIARATGAA
jgi:hypothetical protein